MPKYNNAPTKIESCQRKLDVAIELVAAEMVNTPTLVALHATFKGFEPRLVLGVAETANLDQVFDAVEIKALKITISNAKAAARRIKSLEALARQFRPASDQIVRYSEKIPNGADLYARMAGAAELDFRAVPDLQPFFDLCNEVFLAVRPILNEEVIEKVLRPFNGWLTAKDKTGSGLKVPGRHAEAFKLTEVYAKVLAWQASKPADNADFKAHKTWRDLGYKLRDEAEAPWGHFNCKGHGDEPVKVMPIHPKGGGKWFIPNECHTCHTAGQSVSSGKKGKASREWQAEPDKAYCPPKEDRSDWDAAELAKFMAEVAEKRANKFNLAEKHKAKEEKPERDEIPMTDPTLAILSAREVAENVLSMQIATGTAPKPNPQGVGSGQVKKSGGKKAKKPGKFQGEPTEVEGETNMGGKKSGTTKKKAAPVAK